jgi:hypothetical protein
MKIFLILFIGIVPNFKKIKFGNEERKNFVAS